jgi:hypothetical protein
VPLLPVPICSLFSIVRLISDDFSPGPQATAQRREVGNSYHAKSLTSGSVVVTEQRRR